MNSFKQHIPNFFTGFEPITFKFNTTEELLSHPWVQGWKDDANIKFYRFSLSDNCLMAELNEGKNWRVLGYIENPKLVNLPAWKEKR